MVRGPLFPFTRYVINIQITIKARTRRYMSTKTSHTQRDDHTRTEGKTRHWKSIRIISRNPVGLFSLASFSRRFLSRPSRPVGWCHIRAIAIIAGPVVSPPGHSFSARRLLGLVPRGHTPLGSLQHPRVSWYTFTFAVSVQTSFGTLKTHGSSAVEPCVTLNASSGRPSGVSASSAGFPCPGLPLPPTHRTSAAS